MRPLSNRENDLRLAGVKVTFIVVVFYKQSIGTALPRRRKFDIEIGHQNQSLTTDKETKIVS
jgi:hypothetical protein